MTFETEVLRVLLVMLCFNCGIHELSPCATLWPTVCGLLGAELRSDVLQIEQLRRSIASAHTAARTQLAHSEALTQTAKPRYVCVFGSMCFAECR